MRGGPDLNLQSVGASADKSLDAEILLELFEKQFDLPALAVDGGDGGSGKAAMIGEKDQGALLGLVPDLDAAQEQIAFAVRASLYRKTISSRCTGPRSGTGRRSSTP